MTKKNYNILFNRLLELFPNPDTELNFKTPFQLLIAVMLSAQTTDRQVNIVTDKLFLKVKEPNDVLKTTDISDNDNYRLEWFRMQAEQTNDMEAENEYYEEIAQQGRTTKIFEIFSKWFNLPKRDFNC